MSLDLYIEYPSYCPHCKSLLPGQGASVWDRNITHNITPMWHKAGVYDAFYMSDGHHPSEYIEALERGLADMEARFDEYKKLDAANGWGRAENAIAFLEDALKQFRAYPDLMIHVSK